jgi:hypothetical protein
MSAKSDQLRNDILKMTLKMVDPSWRTGTARYLSLHTSEPVGSDQTSFETTYGSYARFAMTPADWSDSGTFFRNIADISFPTCSSGGALISHIAIGTEETGTGIILYRGALGEAKIIPVGKYPFFAAYSLVVRDG